MLKCPRILPRGFGPETRGACVALLFFSRAKLQSTSIQLASAVQYQNSDCLTPSQNQTATNMCGRFPDCVSSLKDEKTRAAKKAITSENVWHYAKRYPGFVIRNGHAGRKRGVVSTRSGNESRAATQIAGRKPTAVVSQEAGLSCLTNPMVQDRRDTAGPKGTHRMSGETARVGGGTDHKESTFPRRWLPLVEFEGLQSCATRVETFANRGYGD